MPTNNSSDSDLTTTTLNIIATSTYVTLNANPSHQAFYVLGILVFTFCIITVCICFFLQLVRRKRQVLTFTEKNVYTMEDSEQPQQQHGNLNYSKISMIYEIIIPNHR